jgi:putative RecB family exonuclease
MAAVELLDSKQGTSVPDSDAARRGEGGHGAACPGRSRQGEEMLELATILSPTQVSMYLDCAAKWYFRYVVGLPDPKNANLALGISVHSAIATALKLKMAQIDMAPVDAAEEFSYQWREQLDGDTILRDDDNPQELEAVGRALVSRYVAEAAPAIRPAAVEEKIEGTIAGVRVQGRIDVREENGTIRDIKTASRRPNDVAASHRFQIATYVQISPAASGAACVDTLVKTRAVQLVQISHRVDEGEIRQTETMYPLVQEAMRSGLYVPNRGSTLCSRKHCSFWKSCESEFGGSVCA